MEYEPLPDRTAKSPSAPPRSASAARPRRPGRLLRWGLPLVLAILFGGLAGVGVAAAIHVPRVDTVSSFQPGLITQLLDRNGKSYASFARERRVLLRDGEVPRVLEHAVLAAEDSRFYEHGGIDLVGVVRAVVKNAVQGRHAQGASTLTMQLARELFLTREKTWRRKIEESFVAVELEKRFSKQQILTLYCNLMNLGHGHYGMEAASRYYFQKSVKDLSIAEAATLAGIPQRPSAYSPYRRPDLVVKRRNYVLLRMREEGYINDSEYRQAVATPLLVAPQQHEADLGSYFAEDVRRYLEAQYGANRLYDGGLQVQTTLDATLQASAEKALRDGLLRLDHRKGWRGARMKLAERDVETTQLPSWSDGAPVPGNWYEGIVLGSNETEARVRIDDKTYVLDRKGIEWTGRREPKQVLSRGDVAWFRFELPESAEETSGAAAKAADATAAAAAASAGEPKLFLEQEPQLEGALVVIESSTGAVRALVGGWDFRRSAFDRVTQARRQVGSAFKPFVYGAALEMGYTPADTLFDAPAVFTGADNLPSYSPRNYYRKYYGIITLRRALELSVNVTSVKLLDLVGVRRVIDFARRCGVRSPLPPYPSLALGSADLVPLELAAAYASFANQGVYVEPYFVDKVVESDGTTLEQHLPRASKAMDAPVAYVLTHMLEGVVDRGTAGRASGLEIDLAGKTGTTDDYGDAWFVGYTPRYTILNWVGYDVKRSIGHNMTGAEAALPTWQSFVSAGLQDGWLTKGEKFAVPAGVVMQPVEYYTGFLPGPGAERVVDEAFVAGTQPIRAYEPRWAGIINLPYFQQRPFYVPKQGERMPEGVTDWELVRKNWAAK